MRFFLCTIITLFLFTSCKRKKAEHSANTGEVVNIVHARGFHITKFNGYTQIDVTSPWPDAGKGYTYILYEKEENIPEGVRSDANIQVPVTSLVVTSTTHIPALEALGEEIRLTGFPDTRYISSEKTRDLVDKGQVREIGSNENLNTEVLIDLQPDVVIGFALNSSNKAYNIIQQSGIPVVFNGDWMEETPLGKAEWIKFFAPFFGKEAEAESIFEHIESEYLKARKLAENAGEKPTVLSGSIYQDSWILPGGKSWAAQFIADAGADYIWKDTENTGSLFLSLESVLDKAGDADFWIAPSLFTSYKELKEANPHYAQFSAFRRHRVFTYARTRGAGDGLLYFELGPNRPDIILKDLISIFHPEILPGYEPFFFKPLDNNQ
ncbi:ABC transporter substrate-binding protein [Sinomicrobium soli]|nr:ABC transporter substrate-binding protein [Sinomicrobium sp. N-1-3-6]